MRQTIRLVCFAIATLACTLRPALAQNCPQANPFDWNPDEEQIQRCLDAGTQVVLQPGNPGYIIADKIRFRSDDRLLTSVGGFEDVLS